MRHRRALLGLACASLLGGCGLFISDWEVGEGSGATSSGQSTSASSGGADAAEPLTTEEIAGGGIAVIRNGAFRIEAEPESNWQWSRWFHLASSDDLTDPFEPFFHDDGAPWRTTCIWTAFRARSGGLNTVSCDQIRGEPFSSNKDGRFELTDATPVWVTIRNVTEDALSDIEFTTRVYASGRVWTHVDVKPNQLLAEADVGYGEIMLDTAEFEKPTLEEEGLFVMPKPGKAAMLSVDVGELDPDQPGGLEQYEWIPNSSDFTIDDAGSVYYAQHDVDRKGRYVYMVPFQLGSVDDLRPTRADRMADLRQPRLAAIGATSDFGDTGSVYPETGAFDVVMNDGATEVSLRLEGDVKRFEPAFEVHGWPAATWKIMLGEDVIAQTGQPSTKALAALSEGALCFQYLGVIEAGASDGDRTFVISAE